MTGIFPEPAKIMLAGDWHGNCTWARSCVEHAHRQGVDAIVHLGDFGWWVPGVPTEKYLSDLQKLLGDFGITLYWVDGNHEYHPGIDEWVKATDGQPWSHKKYPSIIHLPRGFRWEWWGQTWLALGGAHSVDRLMRSEGRSWWDREHISLTEVERAIAGGKVSVMVTHDCPYGVDIPGIPSEPELDTRGDWPKSELLAASNHRKLLRQVCDEVRPDFLFHGHYHWHYTGPLRYGDGAMTQVTGLAEDGTALQSNTMLLHKRESNETPPLGPELE